MCARLTCADVSTASFLPDPFPSHTYTPPTHTTPTPEHLQCYERDPRRTRAPPPAPRTPPTPSPGRQWLTDLDTFIIPSTLRNLYAKDSVVTVSKKIQHELASATAKELNYILTHIQLGLLAYKVLYSRSVMHNFSSRVSEWQVGSSVGVAVCEVSRDPSPRRPLAHPPPRHTLTDAFRSKTIMVSHNGVESKWYPRHNINVRYLSYLQVKDHKARTMNCRSDILELMARTRLAHLDTTSRAHVLDGMMRMRMTANEKSDGLVRNVILNTRDLNLANLKCIMDSKVGDGSRSLLFCSHTNGVPRGTRRATPSPCTSLCGRTSRTLRCARSSRHPDLMLLQLVDCYYKTSCSTLAVLPHYSTAAATQMWLDLPTTCFVRCAPTFSTTSRARPTCCWPTRRWACPRSASCRRRGRG